MSDMNLCKNELIHSVSAYYQADAYSKNISASGLFEEIDIQPELYQFRELMTNEFPDLKLLIDLSESNGNKGEAEKAIIKAKLTQVYGVPEWFFVQIENSITKYSQNPNGDMTSYRISFLLGSNYIYSLVGGTIKAFGDHVPLREGIERIINDILNANYWEGEIWKQIDCIRDIRKYYYFDDEWIKEYAYRMFVR